MGSCLPWRVPTDTYDIIDTFCWRDSASSFPPLCTPSLRRRLWAWRPPRWWPVRISGPRLTPWPLPANCKGSDCTVCYWVACRCRNPCPAGLWCARGQFFARTLPLWFWRHRYTFYYTINNIERIRHGYLLNGIHRVSWSKNDSDIIHINVGNLHYYSHLTAFLHRGITRN